MTASDGAANDQFGIDLSLSGDRAFIGALQEDEMPNNSGSVYVYDFDGTTWNESQKITSLDGEAGDIFGYSVSLEGSQTLVGAFGDDDKGSVSGSSIRF